MTDEELDQARAEEADRIYQSQPTIDPTPNVIAARLAREGWMPVDPLVEVLKDILAEDSLHNAEAFLDALRATLSNHGYKIVKAKAGD